MRNVHSHTAPQAIPKTGGTGKAGNTLIIAIPSYADRIFPRFDQAREFFFAEINLKQRRIETLTVHPCPAPAHDLCRWLSDQGVSGVMCSGIHQHHQIQLQKLGIWLTWGMTGNIELMLQHWLQNEHTMVEESQQGNFNLDNITTCNETHSI